VEESSTSRGENPRQITRQRQPVCAFSLWGSKEEVIKSHGTGVGRSMVRVGVTIVSAAMWGTGVVGSISFVENGSDEWG
jgi:phosphopantetheinyl transferase